ncbi:MAG: type II toxin-antitoxin system HicB family antitoxin [Thermodesulfobacteriota bacterium]
MKFRAVIKQTDGWWIGWLVDLPGVNAQEETKEELLESLKVGAKEMLEAEIPFEPGFMMEAIDIPEPEWA